MVKLNYVILICIIILFTACNQKKEKLETQIDKIDQNNSTEYYSDEYYQIEDSSTETPDINDYLKYLRIMYVDAESGLRVRNSPSVDGKTLGLLDYLTEVTITKEDDKEVEINDVRGKWVYIVSPIEGWVFDGFLVASRLGEFEYEWDDEIYGIIITNYTGIGGSIEIPEYINETKVIGIGVGAFNGRKLTSVTMPGSIIYIERWAFSGNKLTNIVIPKGVTRIRQGAFDGNQLTSVTIPDSVTLISDDAFSHNQLTKVTIPNSVEYLGYRSFDNNKLTSVNIPNSITRIAADAFEKNQLTSVDIPNSVTQIETRAFAHNNLSSVTIPNSVVEIWSDAFRYNQLTSIVFPDSVTNIGEWSFRNNKLTSITLPKTIKEIKRGAFFENQLTSITIPDSVTYIWESAFGKNPLTSITIGANVKLGVGTYGYAVDESFNLAYLNGGSLAGTYTRPSADSKKWTRNTARN